MIEFEFVDDLPVVENGGVHLPKLDPMLVAFGEALKDKPGEWAKYPKNLSPKTVGVIAQNIKKGRTKSLGDGFEAAVRGGAVYVRYVGDLS